MTFVLFAPKSNFSGLPNILTSFSPQNVENADPKIRNGDGPGNSRKFRFSVEFPQQPSVRGTPGNSFWGPHSGDWGGNSLEEMRVAKVGQGRLISDSFF